MLAQAYRMKGLYHVGTQQLKPTITCILMILFPLLACPVSLCETLPSEKALQQQDVGSGVPNNGNKLFQGFGFAMYVAVAGDAASTEWALSRQGNFEQNPLMSNRGVRISAHVLAPVAAWWTTNWMRRQGHGKAALFLRIGFTAGYAYLTLHNVHRASVY